jgi:PAS domain S-box-containing protein
MKPVTRQRYILFACSAYAVAALAWIFLSDRLLASLVDLDSIVVLSSSKGTFFVLVSVIVFYFMLQGTPSAAEDSAVERPLPDILLAHLWPRWLVYVFAVALVGIVQILRNNLVPVFGGSPQLILFMLPVILAALLGGLGPGLLATAIAAAASAYNMFPVGRFVIETDMNLFHWSVLIFNGLTVSLVSEALHQSRRQENQHRLRLEETSQALAASLTRFRNLFQKAPLAMGLVDKQGIIQDQNVRFEQFFGNTSPDIPTLADWYQRAYPDPAYRAEVEAIWNTAVAGSVESADRIDAGEFRISCKDGQQRIMHIHSIALKEGLLVTFMDVTKRRRSEDELRLWTKSFEQAQVGLVIADARSNCIVSVNSAFALERGYTCEEMSQMPLAQLFPTDCKTDVQHILADLAVKSHGIFEIEHLCKDGRRLPVLLDITVITDAEGRPLHRLAIVLNISERKRIQRDLESAQIQALKQQKQARLAILNQMQDANAARIKAETALAALSDSEVRMRVLINTIPDLIWLKNVDGIYLQCNAAFERYYGKLEADILGHTDYDFVNADLADFFHTNDRRALVADNASINEEWLTFADNGYRGLFQTVKAPVFNVDGHVVGVLGIARDITALRQAEEDLRAINTSLEARVAERTAELDVLNQSLESFVYSVSHDLKAPLRGIEGYSQLLQEDYATALDDDGRLFIANIRNGVTRMGELIDDLLAYSRMERRKLDSNKLDLALMINQLLAEKVDDIAARGVEIRTDLATVWVQADASGLSIVMRNLLENAFKFSARAMPPRIEISLREENHSVIVKISDNGIGFDMIYHDRIFEIFQRLQRVEDYPGTGVGLALVKKAIQRMGGKVWAESELGQGASFYLQLPLARG